jgi:hypothetical protein
MSTEFEGPIVKTCPNRECPDRVERGVIGEFADSAEVCPTCGARLVEAPHDDFAPEETPSHAEAGASDLETAADDDDPDHGVELVCVLSTNDEAQFAMVRSLFECEAIEYIVRGEIHQDFFAVGRASGGADSVVGQAEILVRVESAPRALALLRAEPEEAEPDEPEDDAGLT